MKSVSQTVVSKLLPYLVAQPRTPALVELVRGLVLVHPEFAKLLDVFVEPTAQLAALEPAPATN